MKFRFLRNLCLCFCTTLVAFSCNNSDTPPSPEDDLTQLTLTAEVVNADNENFYLQFTAGVATHSVEYAVVSFQEAAAARADFENLASTTIAVPTEVLPVACPARGSYVCFYRPISAKGDKGEVLEINAICGEAGIEISGYDSIILEYTVRIYYEEKYGSAGVLAISKEMGSDFGMTLEELIQTYAEIGGIALDGKDVAHYAPLNGQQNYEFYLGVALMDPQGNFVEALTIDFTSPDLDNSLPLPEATTVTLDDVQETYAKVSFTPDENTSAYVLAILSQYDYELLWDSALAMGKEDPELYIRDYIYFYTNPIRGEETFEWSSLEAGTEYRVVTYPMNGNGLAGWGPGTIVPFQTK